MMKRTILLVAAIGCLGLAGCETEEENVAENVDANLVTDNFAAPVDNMDMNNVVDNNVVDNNVVDNNVTDNTTNNSY